MLHISSRSPSAQIRFLISPHEVSEPASEACRWKPEGWCAVLLAVEHPGTVLACSCRRKSAITRQLSFKAKASVPASFELGQDSYSEWLRATAAAGSDEW